MPSNPTPKDRASLAEIAERLRTARHVLAISHVAPDGDAIGSLLGLSWLLRSLHAAGLRSGSTEPPVICLACDSPVPPQFRFLPGASEITSAPPQLPWDVIVALDASDPQRLGRAFQSANGQAGSVPVVTIDHHVTNLYFGTLNYVDPEAAATSQILVGLADALGVPITEAAATCLLTGLVTDTLSFRTSNVTPAVLATAMRLMESGASLPDVTQRTMNYKPVSTLRLWALALGRMQLQGRVLWTEITREMRSQAGETGEGDGGLTSQLITAPEASVAAVFSETADGKVEIGFRARPGYDVSQVALSLGGGGHPQASGCTIPGPLAAAEARVLPMLAELVK